MNPDTDHLWTGAQPAQADERDRELEAMQAALRRRTMLLERVLQCGLNEEPHGVGFTPSRQERIASELARDIGNELRGVDALVLP